MEDFLIGLEFEDGSFDFRRQTANSKTEAEDKALSKNNTMVGNPYYPSAIRAVSAKAQ